MAIAAVLSPVAPALAQDAKPEVRPVTPARGGTITTFSFTYESNGSEAFSGDVLYVNGPRGTPCHGMVIAENVGQEGGRQRIHMGPRAKKRTSGNTYWIRPDEPDSEGRRRLTSWCKGVYRGRVDSEGDGINDDYTLVRFRFKVE